MASTPLLCGKAKAEPRAAETQVFAAQIRFNPEGSQYPSFSSFRDALNAQIYSAQHRVCILSDDFQDREIGFALYNASRRAVLTRLRVDSRGSLKSGTAGRLGRLLDELQASGIPVLEKSLKSLRMPEPTILAIDQRAWSISAVLIETSSKAVEVEAAPFTTQEVCNWAEAASSAKAATLR